jgi:hypothetical protein
MASIAKVLAAIIEIFSATASCLPMGAPHCTRSRPQVRDTCSSALLPPATLAGSVRRPVLSVISASLSPFPSPQRMFSRGTFTLVKRITPFSIALSPMKRQRWAISTPGQSASTMNAVIFFLARPFTCTSGVRAITTNSSARVPLVHQSFSPLRMKWRPSSVGVAVARRLAGSDPASTSVRAKAEMAPLAMRGKYCRCCSGVPKSLSGCGRPIDWCAESSAVRLPSFDVTIAIAWT